MAAAAQFHTWGQINKVGRSNYHIGSIVVACFGLVRFLNRFFPSLEYAVRLRLGWAVGFFQNPARASYIHNIISFWLAFINTSVSYHASHIIRSHFIHNQIHSSALATRSIPSLLGTTNRGKPQEASSPLLPPQSTGNHQRRGPTGRYLWMRDW